MIDELHARDVALIRDAVIEPAEGLTVLTGETGAGKTALLGALKLLIGERADATSVREGSEGLEVEGRVYTRGDDLEGHVVRRRVSADGRGRVELDGHMATVHELYAAVGSTVDLCGQHEHQRLLSVATHAELLDAYAGDLAREARRSYEEAFEAARDAAAELERVRELTRSGADAVEEARFVLDRIDAVSPREGELESLMTDLPKAEHAEALIMAAVSARGAISGSDSDEPCAYDLVSSAADALSGAAGFDSSLEQAVSTLSSVLVELEDISSTLRSYRDSIDFDVDSLESMQERMAALQGLMRSYGPGMEGVFERRKCAVELIEAAGDEGQRLSEAMRAVEEAEASLTAAADALDALRADAAPGLSEAISAQMVRLSMGSAGVEVEIERLPRDAWTKAGPSRVELMYRPAAQMSARPLKRIASGGEVSRVMLAVKVVLGSDDEVDTLVFDEVDAGVGGATALALANVIADLARTHQVIVVTHLAQVAVQADRHYLVERNESASGVETRLREVSGQERVAEIARMLSGSVSEASLAHARELLGGRA